MKLTQRLKSWLGFGGAEGSYRGPFHLPGELGHWFPVGRYEDGWQRNLELGPHALRSIPVVAGARLLYRSAFAQMRPEHHRYAEDGTVETVRTSAASRVLLQPNRYESGADLHARVIDGMLLHGESAVLVLRNDRQEVDELHMLPHRSWTLAVDPETRAVFYAVNASGELLTDAINADMAVPARDILHMRWATPRHPLIGETPLAAAGLAAGINVQLARSQVAFFSQMRRPSGVLSTEMTLTKDQMRQLREAFDEQAKVWDKGGLPILSGGLKYQQLAMSASDAEVIETLRMTNEEIARALGVPPPLLGDLSNATLANVEQMVSAWLAFSLGGLVERYERSLDRLFGFNSRTNRVEMDLTALLRTDLAARMEALGKGVMQGVLTPNEARRREGLSPLTGGDDAFMQRQLTPVSLLSDLAGAELARKNEPAVPDPESDDDDEELDADVTRALVHQMIHAKKMRA